MVDKQWLAKLWMHTIYDPLTSKLVFTVPTAVKNIRPPVLKHIWIRSKSHSNPLVLCVVLETKANTCFVGQPPASPVDPIMSADFDAVDTLWYITGDEGCGHI